MFTDNHHGDDLAHGERIAMPAPTAWPAIFALGVALSISGMVTEGYVTAVGVLLVLLAGRGWFRQVLPVEQHELLRVSGEKAEIIRSRRQVERPSGSDAHQQVKPVQTFNLLIGLYGGVAGGAAMLVPAVLYGVVRYRSPWYAVNLLAAGGFPSWANASNSFLAEFHWRGLVAATIISSITMPLVGLLYAAILPMFPKRPILTAGIVVPLFWTALLYSVLGLISPVLNERIAWGWFIPSQLAFGLVTGYVVNRSIHVRKESFQELPFVERAGLDDDVREREDRRGKP